MPRKMRSTRRRSRSLRSYARRAARPVMSIGGGLAAFNAVALVTAAPNGQDVLGGVRDAIKGTTSAGTPVQRALVNMKANWLPIAGGFAAVIAGHALARAAGVSTKIGKIGKYDVRLV